MKKFILFIFSTLFISNICSAEIIREINSFDNSTMLTSVINTKDYVEDIPREIIFKKTCSNSNESKYFISFVNQYKIKNGYSPFEPIKIKFNNSLEDIQSYPIQLYRTAQRGQLAFLVDNIFIDKLEKSDNLQFQIPISTSYVSHVKYIDFTLPQNILDEWKQVIAME